ncbi:hypothetical protein OPV22_016218 [Ensete ventricosum]|uniref:Uncharacterized protein n=1 Tax=Ensete ventricosum TaxID=4639 RepID=A0AAV8QUP0_ENSVE|nr:hypothetical protein OPV22_016218 [Ensete ventricosum]
MHDGPSRLQEPLWGACKREPGVSHHNFASSAIHVGNRKNLVAIGSEPISCIMLHKFSNLKLDTMSKAVKDADS